MSRSAKRLVKTTRRRSNNEDWGPNSGISDETIIEHLNNAKNYIQSAIINTHPNTFNTSVELDLIAGQERYSLPSDLLDSGGIVRVERRLYGVQKWVPLEQGGPMDRSGGYEGIPRLYIRENNDILLRPIPSIGAEGSLRITYKSDFNNLGLVYSSVTASDELTMQVTIDVSADTSDDDDMDRLEILIEAIKDTDYLSLVDSSGNIVVKDLLIDDFDPDTGVIEVASTSFDGDWNDLIGLSVVTGYNAAPFIKAPMPPSGLILDYLVDYAVKELIATDSSVDVQEKILKLQSTEKIIVESYAEFSEDFVNIQDWWRG